MEPKILYGKPVAESVYQRCGDLSGKKLAIITIGEDFASKKYVEKKMEACKRVNLQGVNYRFSEDENFSEIVKTIDELNSDEDYIGIMIQKPIPEKFNKLFCMIDMFVDVDCCTFEMYSQMMAGYMGGFLPATPRGVMELLKFYGYDVSGKHVVIIGRSELVGKPLASLMEHCDATVSLCHSKTNTDTLKRLTHCADIIVSAVGKPHIWGAEYIGDNKPVLIDVGTSRGADGKLSGDFSIKEIGDKCEAYTPVPFGIGPVTVSMLMLNCSEA